MSPALPRSAIAVSGLRKNFGDTVVLDGIDLEVAEGTVFSLLGPNRAGKTTAVQILSILFGADGGAVRVAGHDVRRKPDAARAAIGVTGQFSAADGLLTGEENLSGSSITRPAVGDRRNPSARRAAPGGLDQVVLADQPDVASARHVAGGNGQLLDRGPWSVVQHRDSTNVHVQTTATRTHVLAGLVICGICGRRMDAHWVNQRLGYRCVVLGLLAHGRGVGRAPFTVI